ncbi:Lrp/AsnC family transcriptional regulator [Salinadaptatus halalkaliphilus]|uniref:Lrp/AsnC family transcriptional regulator n=1 Tax=Salinadaptatus halalkaliphilus TaxID=2419781 RepID=A0A4S3TIA9_9EURY|nr:Lrp/AsnC family transcriptional regulator [Salinadaptatus halalkaliphilus]THE63676.1 Lrp/AsnC family transcriptional regulator [Salinadaptatus halalkaliphilus]
MSDGVSGDQSGTDAMLEMLQEVGPITIPELAGIVDRHPATVERRCHVLQRQGRIRQCTGGVVTVIDETRQRPTVDD